MNKDYNCNLYTFIRKNGGWDNWDMIKICDINPCLDKYDKIHAEQKYCDELKPKLNSLNPIHDAIKYKSTRTIYNKEHRLKNLDKRLAYAKIWREKNKDYQKINKDRINKQCRERYAKKKLIESSSLV